MSRHGLLRSLFAAAALLGAAGVFAASAEPLRLEVYNPGAVSYTHLTLPTILRV